MLATGGTASADPIALELPTGPVGHDGRWLVDSLGRVLLVHGVNIVNKSVPYYPAAIGFSDSYADWLKDNGFLLVRVGVLATGLMPTPGVVDRAYIHHIANTVHLLARHGIFSLLDFHQDGYGPAIGDDGFPAWMTLTGNATNTHTTFPLYYVTNPAIQQAFQSFWDNLPSSDGKGLQDDYSAMFAALGKTFGNNPYVIGYDLFNEPWPGTAWLPCLASSSGCPSEDTGELGPAYARALAAIRGSGDKHLVFGEPFSLFNFGQSTTSIPLPGGDPESGMSFHMYAPDVSKEPNVLANAISWSQETGGALLNTEFGATRSTPDIARQTGELNSALFPWTFWSIGEIVNQVGQPVDPSNITQSTVEALVQPYPLAVSGTPLSDSYSQSSHVLQFSWSTTGPHGRRFDDDGAPTVFEVPPSVYQSGYRVVVKGGTVTSPRCAPLLTVAPHRHARNVSLALLPARSCGQGGLGD